MQTSHRNKRTESAPPAPSHRQQCCEHRQSCWESSRAPSLLAKAFRLLNGIQQLLLQLFIALVRRQIQAVKAGETGCCEWGGSPVLLPPCSPPEGPLPRVPPAAASHGRRAYRQLDPHAAPQGHQELSPCAPHSSHSPRMAPRQPRLFANFIDAEFLRPVAAC